MKTVFITGAAQGIGLAVARGFAARGWFVGLYDINSEALEALLVSPEFAHACGQQCDVTRLASIAAALAHVAGHSRGRMDVWVNNAGVLTSGNFEQIDPRDHKAMIAVNIVGLTLVAQQAFPLLKQTPRATVVNLCSASSIHGVPLLAVYRASKFTVNGLTESLNIEWAQHDIRVTAAKPPIVNTATGYQLNPRLTRKFGIDMSPQDVARVILRAVVGGRSGYVIGASARLRAWLDTCLPAALHRGLVRYLTGCSCRNPAITIPAI